MDERADRQMGKAGGGLGVGVLDNCGGNQYIELWSFVLVVHPKGAFINYDLGGRQFSQRNTLKK